MSYSNEEDIPLVEIRQPENSRVSFSESIRYSAQSDGDNKYLIYVEAEEEYIDEDDDKKEHLKEELFQCIESGDLIKVERALENGAPPNTTCFVSLITGCHFAAFRGHHEILQTMIDKGADPSNKDIDGRTALDFALWNGHAKCVKILLEHFKEMKQYSMSDGAPSGKRKRVFLKDMESSLKPELDAIWNESTPLHIASGRLHDECIQLLLKDGYDPNVLDKNKNSPLDVCGDGYKTEELKITNSSIDEMFKRTVQLLLQRVNIRGSLENISSSPLHKAVLVNSKTATKLLIDVIEYRTSFDTFGETPLHLAILNKAKNVLQVFKGEKIIDFKNRDGLTPLQVAIKIKWRKGILILLKTGVDILATNNEGDTALHIAARSANPYILQDIINALPDKKKQIDMRNNDFETALFKAIESGDDERVKILLTEGASITISLKTHLTPIHRAVQTNQRKILRRLLTADSKLPPDRRIIHHYTSLDASLIGGMAPIHLAAIDNKLDCIKILLEFEANLFQKTMIASYTPLHLAASHGHVKTVEFLILQNSELLDEKDANQWKPFYLAVHKGHRNCVSLFLDKGGDLSEVLTYKKKRITVMELLVTNMPRSVNYLESLFDNSISKNDREIDDEDCQIEIDYSLLMIDRHTNEKKSLTDNQMDVVVALVDTGKRAKQRKLLLHPFIESFLYIKWTNLKYFYAALVVMYILYVLSLTWTVLRIYSKDYVENWNNYVLWAFVGYLIVQETIFIIILIKRRKIVSYMKRFIGITNWLNIVMTIIFLSINHEELNAEWAKILTASAVLLAWIEITVLLSHFPECGYTFQMFSTVTTRAFKVMLLFGIQVLIGFALALWIMFHGTDAYGGVVDSVVRTIVMTSEFDYADLFTAFEPSKYRIFVQFVFVLFVFFVPIVMMNLILALIISDTNDLKAEGKIKRLASQARLIDVLDTVRYFLMRNKVKRVNKITRIHPGKASWESISLVTNNIEESLFERVKPKKNNGQKPRHSA